MGQQDLYQSDFYEDKNRFADVFNGVLFNGREVMKPEELEAEDSVKVRLRDGETGKKIICDKIRKWKGKYVSLLVLENQSYVDYRMVLRVMESEVIGYDTQRKEANRKNLEEGIKLVGDEYPSGIKKGQKLVPIITLVLYMGKDKLWDGARSLYEMLEVDEEIKPFVNDFKLNLFDYHDWEDFSRFKTANRLLFEALSCRNDVKKMKRVLQKNIENGKVDREGAKAIRGILGVKFNLDAIKTKDEEGREVYDLCKAFDDYKEEGRREGKREGRREGEQEMALKLVKKLMENQEVSFDVAVKMLGISKSRKKQLSALM